MNIKEIANRIANLHYPDIPETRGDKMCRRQRVIELQKLVESELKNCSTPDVVVPNETLICEHPEDKVDEIKRGVYICECGKWFKKAN